MLTNSVGCELFSSVVLMFLKLLVPAVVPLDLAISVPVV